MQFSRQVGSKRFSKATQRLWWQLFGADFHQKCFFSHGLVSLLVLFAHREAQHFAGGVISLSNRFSQGTDAQNVALAFSHGDGFTRVQQVEAMGGFQNAFVSRQRQRLFKSQQGLRFFFVLFKTGKQEIDVGVFEVIGGLLHFILMEHVAVGGFTQWAIAPYQVIYAVYALDVHRQTLKTVGDFAGNGFTFQTAHLLEVGELRHFHAVEPHFPAETPGAKRRIFPVILYKTDIIDGRIQTHFFQRTEIEFLDIIRRRLDDDLELVVMLQPVGVFTVTAVGGAA